MKPSLTKHIIFDFFDGKATAIQRKYIEAWIADEENQELYYQYLDEWESQRPQFAVDSEKAFGAFQQILQETQPRPPQPVLVKNNAPFWTNRALGWRIAASVLVVSLLGAYLFRAQIRFKTYQTAYGQTAVYQLADGTTVTLNANSLLRVPRFGFGSDTREVFLEGEGEFRVTHTADNQRFVVRTADKFQVEVLGTEFVVYARQRGKRVFLNKGKVKLELAQGQQVYMKPGNVVTVANSGQYQLRQTAPARPFVAWKEHWFYFDNTPVAEVAIQIQERFGVNVVVPETDLAQRRIAGNFKAEKADDLLEILADLLQLTVVKTRHHIELRTIKQS
ncbi:FecR family protein [Spirosoma linguale]|uniref:Anti-FecI sigma factor, FecR n=1 Tax=Spirosoma linguale (strain ATCC 33905 / DSM 74 / LMG 10896 / Claus 1) TaxID=504472 RepID=D2QL30_SPILD|nr:anti-FecI sigma factor, FecR [Spirosoma linguale DSM 74]